MEKVISLGEKKVGEGAPCFLVAEVGINHNGDLALAKKSIDAAAHAGADAVKFQNYRTEDFILDPALTYTYLSQGKEKTESQKEMFKRCEFSFAQWQELKNYCDAQQIIFFSTPSSEATLQDLVQLQVPLLKNGSDYLGHLPLIRAMAKTKIPTVLSTGMAVFEEMQEAVDAFCEAGGTRLILLHCTSSYPTPAGEVNLHKIAELRRVFQCPIGFSDHSAGIIAAMGAVALGACFIEKHFTLDKTLAGPDHSFSSDPSEFSDLVQAVRTLEKNMGVSTLGPTLSEQTGRRDFRLSCVAASDLSKGKKILQSDVVFRRPGTGFSPKSLPEIEGKFLKRDLKAGEVFKPEDFE